jgi:hypothetical protein
MGHDHNGTRQMGKVGRGITAEIGGNTLGHVANVRKPLTNVRLVHVPKRFGIALDHLVEHELGVAALVTDLGLDLIDQDLVADKKEVSVEDLGVTLADDAGNALLKILDLGLGLLQGHVETLDLRVYAVGGKAHLDRHSVDLTDHQRRSDNDPRRNTDAVETHRPLAACGLSPLRNHL